MKPVIIHPEAGPEIEDAVRFYDNRIPGLGSDLRADVEASVASALTHPVAAGKYPGTPCRQRQLDRFPFTLIYRDRPSGLYVYALAHDKRRPGYWKHRLRP